MIPNVERVVRTADRWMTCAQENSQFSRFSRFSQFSQFSRFSQFSQFSQFSRTVTRLGRNPGVGTENWSRFIGRLKAG